MSGDTSPTPPATGGPPGQPIDVSFAVACYNAGAYLEPAIRSALAQQDVTLAVQVPTAMAIPAAAKPQAADQHHHQQQ